MSIQLTHEVMMDTLKENNKIRAAVTLFFLVLVGYSVRAQEPEVTLAQPGYYKMQLGEFKVTALSDGTLPIDLHQLLTNTSTEKTDAYLSQSYEENPVAASVNAYLIEHGDTLILVDAGTSELYGPMLGYLPQSMKRAGFDPNDVDAVLITHIHTDHTGGLMKDNKMVFPNATVYVSKPEFDFWLAPGSREKAEKRLTKLFDEAELKMLPLVEVGKVKTFDYDQELFEGINPVASPGHTPGHTFYALESKGEKLVFWGDIMHSAAVQFNDPSVTIVFDVNPEAAAAQRKKAYEDAANNGYWVAIDHVSFPGIGHVRADQGRYVWVPINYSTYAAGQ